jgi:uncharacterized metal-binding protein YceD (DUF177 family)
MTGLPLSRPIAAADVPDAGTHVSLKAMPEERAAVARNLKLPEIKALAAELDVKPSAGGGVRVTGNVTATVVQTCVVTLEPFEAEIREQVDVRYTSDAPHFEPGSEHEADLDAPDVLINGGADLGTLVVEHLALGLDPYPRKPGVEEAAAADDSEPATHRPFAGLDKLVAAASSKKK